MNIIYSIHARKNMIERRISKEDVEEAILNPDKITESRKGRKISQKVIGNRLLRVIYLQTEKVYIIVTSYYTRLGKY